jgi:hypothetical protein
MSAIIKVSLEKIVSVSNPVIDTYNGRNAVVVHLDNGTLRTFQHLLSELGNNGFDKWSNIEKIKNSSSDKNRFNYIKKFENELKSLNVI